MGIAGIGLDVVDVAAFGAQVAEPHSAFVAGTFTAAEIATSGARPGDPPTHLAARFAAKEAFVKAWSGARLGRAPALEQLDMREIEVVPDAWQRPSVVLRGQLAESVAESLGTVRVHLSLSHDGGVAAAVVVLEAR